jgi:hypothetical protein
MDFRLFDHAVLCKEPGASSWRYVSIAVLISDSVDDGTSAQFCVNFARADRSVVPSLALTRNYELTRISWFPTTLLKSVLYCVENDAEAHHHLCRASSCDRKGIEEVCLVPAPNTKSQQALLDVEMSGRHDWQPITFVVNIWLRMPLTERSAWSCCNAGK